MSLKRYWGNLTGARVSGQKAVVSRAKQAKDAADIAAASARAKHGSQSKKHWERGAKRAQDDLDEHFPKNPNTGNRPGHKKTIPNRGKINEPRASRGAPHGRAGRVMRAKDLRKARDSNLRHAVEGTPYGKSHSQTKAGVDQSRAQKSFDEAGGRLRYLTEARGKTRRNTAIGAAAVGITGAGTAGAVYAHKKKKKKTHFEARLENMEFALDERLIEFVTPRSVWQAGINAKPTIDNVLKGRISKSKSGFGQYARTAKAKKLADLRKKSDEWRKYSKSGKGTHDMKVASESKAESFRKAAKYQKGSGRFSAGVASG